MTPQDLRIIPEFSPEDRSWLRLSKIEVPAFWHDHGVSPQTGDVVRLGNRQFVIEARVWEHDGATPVLRLFMGSSHAQSDTTFG